MFTKKKGFSPLEKKAKLTALGAANDMATEALKGKLSGIKKVSVVSDDKQGLEKGLEKAKKIVGAVESEDESEDESEGGISRLGYHGDEDEEEGESCEMDEESEPQDEEEIDTMIAHLMKMKEKMQSSKG
jgi:hypothetical protein